MEQTSNVTPAQSAPTTPSTTVAAKTQAKKALEPASEAEFKNEFRSKVQEGLDIGVARQLAQLDHVHRLGQLRGHLRAVLGAVVEPEPLHGAPDLVARPGVALLVVLGADAQVLGAGVHLGERRGEGKSVEAGEEERVCRESTRGRGERNAPTRRRAA